MKRGLISLIALAACLCLLPPMSVSANTGELIDVSGGTSGVVTEPGDGGGTTPPATEPATAPPTEPATAPPTEPEAKYVITIAAPRGWSRKTATVTVKLEDESSTGFTKAEAKFGSNGAWQDISDSLRSYGWAQLEISENGTVYVSVTDKTGKAHVKSLYIECFDREAPTIRAKIEGNSLRAETEDAHSGVEYIYVNGYSFDYLTDGTLDIRVREYAETDEESVFVYAVDYAGNKSKTAELKNPRYEPPESEKPEASQPATTPPAVTAPTAPTVPVTQAPVVSTPAASAPAQTEPAQEPDETEDNGSVTPVDGTGTVIENSVKNPGQREFFTVTTEADNTFYIVVDKQKQDNNVYLLSAVTEDDLTGLAEKSEGGQDADTLTPAPTPIPASPPEPATEPSPEEPPEPATEPETEPAPTEQTEPTPAEPEKGGGGTVAIVVIIVLAAGGIGYYFKILRPKQEMYVDEDEYEGMDMPAQTGDGLHFTQDGARRPAPAQNDEQDDGQEV